MTNPQGAQQVPDQAAQVSGKAILGVFGFVQQTGGDSFLQQLIGSLPSPAKGSFARDVRRLAYYPYGHFAALLRIVDRMMGRGDLSVCRELGGFAGKRDLDSIFAIYKQLQSPTQLIRACDLVWKQYYQNAGVMKAVSSEPENTVVQIESFRDMDPAHCRLMEGWMTKSLEECGAVVPGGVRERRCMQTGAPCHEFVCTWDGPRGATPSEAPVSLPGAP